MDKENSITLSKYRFEQAKENLEEASLLFKESIENKAIMLIFT